MTTTAKTKRQRRDWRPRCVECGGIGELCTGVEIYPHRPDLADKHFYRCDCGAKVGCHKGTIHPLGLCAGKETQQARIAAHAALDPLWRAKMVREGISQTQARAAAYKWLAERMGIDGRDCHISRFDTPMAMRVVEICRPYADKIRRVR